jgi:hypothetical protein
MSRHIINLVPEDKYRRETYGIPLVSETQHDFAGRGIHNRHHRHSLDVWDNIVRPDPNGSGQMIDPHGQVTSERYSYSFSPHANVISAHRGAQPVMGSELRLGDVVILQVHGYEIGLFQVRARALHNPHLVRIDEASSASRQHFIETGDYLTPDEVAEYAS